MTSAMEAQIARLQAHHRVPLPQPAALPLAEPTDCPLIVAGLASTFDFDSARCAIAPYALSWPSDPLPPLLYRHDPKQIAGRIMELGFDDRGRLRIRAYVDHQEAKRAPAFSIGFTVQAYEIVNPDSPSSFHSLVRKGVVTECSLTPEPCNRHALVQSRTRASPACDDVLSAVERFRKALDGLMLPQPPQLQPVRERPEISAAPALIYGRLPIAMLSKSQSPFSQLVAHLPVGD